MKIRDTINFCIGLLLGVMCYIIYTNSRTLYYFCFCPCAISIFIIINCPFDNKPTKKESEGRMIKITKLDKTKDKIFYYIFLGASTGIIAVTSAIHLNVRVFKACVSYFSCTNTYLFTGFLFLIVTILYGKLYGKYRFPTKKECGKE